MEHLRGYGDNRRIRAPRFVDENDRMTRLDHLVAIGSTDVRVHLERLNIHISAGDEPRAYGAIVDLFIASGPTAHEVRSRALFWAGRLLSGTHRQALQGYVGQGLSADTPMPAAPHSLLSLGVTGSLRLVGPVPAAGEPPAPSLSRAEASARPQPAPELRQEPPTPQSSMPTRSEAVPHEPQRTPFFPERTVIAFVKRYTALPTTPTHAWYVSAPFGRCAIWGNSVWFQVEDEARLGDDLTQDDLDVRRIDALRLDSSQAQPARVVLWNLGAYISDGRLPADLPDGPMILRSWPDLTRVARIRQDTRLAALLSRTPTRACDLPDRPNVRAFLAAAWVSGALVPAEQRPSTVRSDIANRQPVPPHALRGLVSRLRRKAE